MAYADVTWSYGELATSAKLQQMADNDTYLKSAVDTLGTPVSYVPTVTGMTLGDGTISGSYIAIGKLVFAQMQMVFGASSAMSGLPIKFSLPVAASGTFASVAGLYDSGSGINAAMCRLVGSNIEVYNLLTSGTYGAWSSIGASTPMLWTAGDYIFANAIYRSV